MSPNNYVKSTIRNFDELESLLDEIISSFSGGSDMKVPFKEYILAASADLKKQLSDAIFDKAQQLLDQNDIKNDHILLRRFFKFLISVDKKEILDALETYYTSDRNQVGYIILIEEMLKLGKDVSGLVKTFFSLLKINGINYEVVDRLLTSISKDRFFLVQELVKNSLNEELLYYICNLFQSEKEFQFMNDVCRAVKTQKNNFATINQYFIVTSYIISFDKSACETLFEDEKELNEFENWFLKNYPVPLSRSNNLTINYANFLENERFLNFEKNLISQMDSSFNLLTFAKQVNNSSKRLILKKLVSLKNELYLIEFIKSFPEYKHLLILL